MPEEFINIPNAEKIAKTHNIELIEKSGEIMGEMLRETGINMNFAPVMDIGSKYNKKLLGNRTYSDNEDQVSKYSIKVMKGMQSKRIISVIKHFPGHGATKLDSHYFVPVISKKMKNLEKEDIQPFKKAIQNGAEAIMVGHLIVSEIDKFYPASLSPQFIVKYLRKKLKFTGVIITDDLKMKAISILYGKTNSILLALKAGNDIILTKNKYSIIKKSIKKIKKQIKKKKITEKRINRSVKRILELKQKYNIIDEQAKGVNIKEINNKIEKLKREIEKNKIK